MRRCEWDHPRGCGENYPVLRLPINSYGSPPRMRGKPPPGGASVPPPRITPADAGKTVKVLRPKLHAQDHPRGCGENTESMEEIAVSLGSPPRMRGKP